MKKQLIGIGAVALFLSLSMSSVNAALTTIGLATYNGADYNLIWEKDNNGNSLVWLDYSNVLDPNINIGAAWPEQQDWATSLGTSLTYSIHEGYKLTWTADWRLWQTNDGPYQSNAGYNITSSELGHLFYEELGNRAGIDSGVKNTGRFENLLQSSYWSNTEHCNSSWSGVNGWGFDFNSGYQGAHDISVGGLGLSVREGDVAIIHNPEPATVYLFCIGCVGLYLNRKKGNNSSLI